MDDQVLVRVTHRRANLQEELHALTHRELACLAVAIDGLADDQLHHHVGRSGLRRASIEQPCDIAMVERGENLPLGPETLLGQAAAHVRAHELDGDLGVVVIVIAHCPEHVSHAAGAEDADDPVRPDALADATARGARGREGVRTKFRGDRVEESAGPFVRLEQRLHFGEQLRVVARLQCHEGRAIVARQVQRRREQRLHRVARSRHGVALA